MFVIVFVLLYIYELDLFVFFLGYRVDRDLVWVRVVFLLFFILFGYRGVWSI